MALTSSFKRRFSSAFGATLVGFATWSTALAQARSVEQCSQSFHATFKTATQPAFSALMDATRTIVRAPDKTLPGRWLMTPSRTVNAKAKLPAPERVCAQEAERGGRTRCIRFVEKPLGFDAVDFEPRTVVPAEDLAQFKLVHDLVEGRGVPPELGPNGRHALVYQRLLNEMSGYVAQPAHPALCVGVPYMLDFYAKELSGLKTRIGFVGAQATKFEDGLATRMTQLRALAPSVPDGVRSPDVAIVEAARLLLPAESLDRVQGFSGTYARLQAAKIALIEAARQPVPVTPAPAVPSAPVAPPGPGSGDAAAQPIQSPTASVAPAPPGPTAVAPAAGSPAAITVSPEVRAMAVRVLRFAEATLYARLYAERLDTINARVDTLLDGLRKNHAEHCLCGAE